MIKLLFSGDFAPLVPPRMIFYNQYKSIEPILPGMYLHITSINNATTPYIKKLISY